MFLYLSRQRTESFFFRDFGFDLFLSSAIRPFSRPFLRVFRNARVSLPRLP